MQSARDGVYGCVFVQAASAVLCWRLLGRATVQQQQQNQQLFACLHFCEQPWVAS
jgi:hypothetical protein